MLPPIIPNVLKTIFSTVLVFASVVVLIVGLSSDANIADMGGFLPESIIFCLSLLLLAANEGFQVGVVSIQHLTNTEVAMRGYVRAEKTHRMMFHDTSGQLKRLLIGQSFMVVTCSFLIAQLTTFPNLSMNELCSHLTLSAPISTSSAVDAIFYVGVQSGLPGVIITVIFAQLLPSIFSKQYPLQFLNIFGIHTVIRFALMIESVGIVKFVYVIFGCFKYLTKSGKDDIGETSTSSFDLSETACKFFGDDDDDDDDDGLEFAPDSTGAAHSGASMMSSRPRREPKNQRGSSSAKESSCCASTLSRLLTCLSFCLTLFSVLFLVYGTYHGFSSFGQKIPALVQGAIMMLVLLIVFYCEGLKIAIVSTAHLDQASVQAMGGNSRALQVHRLLHPPSASVPHTKSHGSGQDTGDTASPTLETVDNVKRFLLGRQQMVVPLGFLFAQLTHYSFLPQGLLPACLYYPLVTVGVPGILVLLQFAQLTPQLLAEELSLSFLGMRGAYSLTKAALLIETLGITSFTWILFECLNFAMRTQVCHRREEEFDHYDDTDSADDRLISIELGNRQNFSFLVTPKKQLQYLSNPVQDSDAISV